MAATSAEQQQQHVVATRGGPHSPCAAAGGSEMVSWLARRTEMAAGAAEAEPLQPGRSTPAMVACVSTVSTTEEPSSRPSSPEPGAELGEGRLDASPRSNAEHSAESSCDEAAAAKVHSRRRCFRKRCCACSSLVVLALALLVFALTLSKPAWQLSSLVVQPEVMNGLIKAFTDTHFNSSISVPIDVEVEVQNNNLVGAQAGTGHFTVLSGDHVLAHVTTEPVAVHARGRSAVRAQSTSTITPETSRYLLRVLPPAFEIRPRVVGEVPATVLGGLLALTITLGCEVDVDVMQILSDPTNLIKDRRCFYGAEF